MSCPFPGGLFSQFRRLEGLYLSANAFTVRSGRAAGPRTRPGHAALMPPTIQPLSRRPLRLPPRPQGDINGAARSLVPLKQLQEFGISSNKLTGSLAEGGPVCDLVQARGVPAHGASQGARVPGQPGRTCCACRCTCALTHACPTHSCPAAPAGHRRDACDWGHGPGRHAARLPLCRQLHPVPAVGSRQQAVWSGPRCLPERQPPAAAQPGRGAQASAATLPCVLGPRASACCSRGPVHRVPPSLTRTWRACRCRPQNKLTGEVPPSLTRLPTLAYLDLSNNTLSGGPWVPAQRGAAAARGRRQPPTPPLIRPHPRAAGSVPDFAAASELVALYLDHNKLTGALPAGLAMHPTLRMLYLDSNNLTALPAAWADPATGPRQSPLLQLVCVPPPASACMGRRPCTRALAWEHPCQPACSPHRRMSGIRSRRLPCPLCCCRLSGNPIGGAFPMGLAANSNLTYLMLSGVQLRCGAAQTSLRAWLRLPAAAGCVQRATHTRAALPLSTAARCPTHPPASSRPCVGWTPATMRSPARWATAGTELASSHRCGQVAAAH